MKPTSPQQLARLLDQVRGLYPNGIPVRALVVDSLFGDATEPAPCYHFFIAGASELSPVTSALLEGIASKGLQLSRGDYHISFVPESDVAQAASKSASQRVIVFGSPDSESSVDRGFGEPVLFTYSLERLATDPALKRELWRSLQTFLTPA